MSGQGGLGNVFDVKLLYQIPLKLYDGYPQSSPQKLFKIYKLVLFVFLFTYEDMFIYLMEKHRKKCHQCHCIQ